MTVFELGIIYLIILILFMVALYLKVIETHLSKSVNDTSGTSGSQESEYFKIKEKQ